MGNGKDSTWTPPSQSLKGKNHLKGKASADKPKDAQATSTQKKDNAPPPAKKTRIERIRETVPATATPLLIRDKNVLKMEWPATPPRKPNGSLLYPEAATPKQSPYYPKKRGMSITFLVIHGLETRWAESQAHCDSMIPGHLARWQMQYHYAIGRDGGVSQYVPEDHWVYGSLSGAKDEQGIQVELALGNNDQPATPAQLLSLVRLIVFLCERHPKLVTVYSHSWLAHENSYGTEDALTKYCPGMAFMNGCMFNQSNAADEWNNSKFKNLLALFDLDSTCEMKRGTYVGLNLRRIYYIPRYDSNGNAVIGEDGNQIIDVIEDRQTKYQGWPCFKVDLIRTAKWLNDEA